MGNCHTRWIFGIILFLAHFNTISIAAFRWTRNQASGQTRPPLTVRLLNSVETRLANRYRLHTLPALNTENRVRSRGYPFETHNIQSEDGYGLQLHRIPHGANDKEYTEGRPVVLLNHGIFESSLGWVINYDTNDCLAFILADAGFDVWLANSRGNAYSNTHQNYTIRDSAYWNFSQHEMGVYDLPVTIDCILNTTKQAKLHYIGFSLSSATILILLSERPEYNEKISSAILLAPGVYTHHGKGLRLILPLQHPIQLLQNVIGPFPISPESVALFSNQFYLVHLCDGRLTPTRRFGLCRLIARRPKGRLHGNSQSPIQDQYSTVNSKLVTAVSSKVLLHLNQVTRSRRFQFYDYGNAINLKIYKTPNPPEYNLANARVPISIFYADADAAVTRRDVQLLASKLPNVEEVYRVPDRRFTHDDFTYSGRANELVYRHILEVLKKP